MNSQEYKAIHGNQDYYFAASIRLSALTGAVIHALLIPYFFLISVHELGFYNIGSSLFFLSFYLLLRRQSKYTMFFFVLGAIEVIFHALLATHLVGAASGFNLFVWVIPTVLIIDSRVNYWVVGLIMLGLGSLYLCTQEVAYFRDGVYDLEPRLEQITFYVALLSLLSTGLAVNINFRLIVRQKEQIILREIHHRIKNNLQIVSSIASIRNHGTDSDAANDLVADLQSDVYYLSALHNQVRIMPGGTQLNFSAFADDLFRRLLQKGKEGSRTSMPSGVMLEIDRGVPLGLMLAQVIEALGDVAATLPETCEFDLQIDVEQEAISVVVTISGSAVSAELIRQIPTTRMDLIEILAEQIEATYSFDYSDSEVSFKTTSSLP